MTRRCRWSPPLALALIAAAAVGCSDDGGVKTDGAAVDGPKVLDSGVPDGYVLWPCELVGQACNAHDPCAINPICGADKLCRPSKLQKCDDGLSCTDDICKGMGLCENTPKEGSCALPVKVGGAADGGVSKTELRCFVKGDKKTDDPCLICDPETDGSKWTGANGGVCDDGSDCTKDDYCQAGQCKGTYYGSQCADAYGCTEDLCDGKGGCLGNKLKSDWCLINGVCYQDKQNDPTGSCNTCDVSVSQSVWTPITNTCQINGKCYKPGDKHTGGCAECDPTVNASAWTIKGNDCLINDVCKKPQDKDATGCSECDPTTSKSAWTPLTGLCLINGKCYKNADKHSGGCAECDTAISNTSWTVKGSYCLVSDQCKNPKDKDTTGCSECDPATDKYGWTVIANQCLISGTCYANGAKDSTACGECDPAVSNTSWTVKTAKCLIAGACLASGALYTGGCASCDPTKSKYAWTPDSGKCLINGACYVDKIKHAKTTCLECAASSAPTSWSPVSGANATVYDFEQGAATGWSITNSDTKVGWVVSTKRPLGGSYALYYGNPTTGNYDDGGIGGNSGSATTPAVTLTAGKKAGLSFMLYMDTEVGTSYDALTITVNGTKVWESDSTINVPYGSMQTWLPFTVDLSTYAGQTVSIVFKFDTMDSIANSTEGVHLDDIIIYENC